MCLNALLFFIVLRINFAHSRPQGPFLFPPHEASFARRSSKLRSLDDPEQIHFIRSDERLTLETSAPSPFYLTMYDLLY